MQFPKGSESALHYDVKMAIAEVFARHGYDIRMEKIEGKRRYDVWGTNGDDVLVAEINLNHDPTKIRIRSHRIRPRKYPYERHTPKIDDRRTRLYKANHSIKQVKYEVLMEKSAKER